MTGPKSGRVTCRITCHTTNPGVLCDSVIITLEKTDKKENYFSQARNGMDLCLGKVNGNLCGSSIKFARQIVRLSTALAL